MWEETFAKRMSKRGLVCRIDEELLKLNPIQAAYFKNGQEIWNRHLKMYRWQLSTREMLNHVSYQRDESRNHNEMPAHKLASHQNKTDRTLMAPALCAGGDVGSISGRSWTASYKPGPQKTQICSVVWPSNCCQTWVAQTSVTTGLASRFLKAENPNVTQLWRNRQLHGNTTEQ